MTQHLVRALLTVACVGAALLGGATAATGASSPEGAVEALVERIGSGGFERPQRRRLSRVRRCHPRRVRSVRIGLRRSAASASRSSTPAITLVSEEEGTAIVNLAATMRVTFDEEQLREYVRAQLEAGGQEATDEAVEAMIGALASGDVPVDEDLTVVERDGEWLICEAGGGFTDEGMCGLVSPDDIAALAPVPIQSNVGSGDFCQWIGATDIDYFSVDVGLIRDASLDDYRAADPDAQDVTAAGQPAIASFGQLLVEVDQGILSVVPYLEDSPSAEGIDPIEFATSVAELFVPRLGELPATVDEDTGGSTDPNAGLLADCGVISLDDLAAIGPLTYDSVSGSGGYCVYSSTDTEAGAPFVTISIDATSSVADLRTLFPGGTDRRGRGSRRVCGTRHDLGPAR